MRINLKNAANAAVLCVFLPAAGFAGDIIYTPINPSFGGSPLNGSFLRSMADAQKSPERQESSADATQEQVQRFVASLQSRLLSEVSRQVADAIFGENPQESGRVVFGDTSVTFLRGLETVSLTISDPLTGDTTIEIPVLTVE